MNNLSKTNHTITMQLTTIFAIFFACLVLFASVDYTNGGAVKGKRPANHPNSFAKRNGQPVVYQNDMKMYGRRQFSGRQIVESIKQRRARQNL
ncbi:hypothetical protein I4U23_025127 [Adineta vaga]|nr:hypothetical protein I4U23_025127 [Adineta vaga]